MGVRGKLHSSKIRYKLVKTDMVYMRRALWPQSLQQRVSKKEDLDVNYPSICLKLFKESYYVNIQWVKKICHQDDIIKL